MEALTREKAAVDELTGRISATARMRPNGRANLGPKSVKTRGKRPCEKRGKPRLNRRKYAWWTQY